MDWVGDYVARMTALIEGNAGPGALAALHAATRRERGLTSEGIDACVRDHFADLHAEIQVREVSFRNATARLFQDAGPAAPQRRSVPDVVWIGLTEPYVAPSGLRLHPVTHLQGLDMLVSACDGIPRPAGPFTRWLNARLGLATPERPAPDELAERARTGRLQIYAILDGSLPVGYARLAPVAGGVALEAGGLSCLDGIRKAAERAVASFAAAVTHGDIPVRLRPDEGLFSRVPGLAPA